MIRPAEAPPGPAASSRRRRVDRQTALWGPRKAARSSRARAAFNVQRHQSPGGDADHPAQIIDVRVISKRACRAIPSWPVVGSSVALTFAGAVRCPLMRRPGALRNDRLDAQRRRRRSIAVLVFQFCAFSRHLLRLGYFCGRSCSEQRHRYLPLRPPRRPPLQHCTTYTHACSLARHLLMEARLFRASR